MLPMIESFDYSGNLLHTGQGLINITASDNVSADLHFDKFVNKKWNRDDDERLLCAALHYIDCGFFVFPCHSLFAHESGWLCSCRNGHECLHPGKHPKTRKGVKDATNDKVQIHEWWSKWPTANIAIRTGKASGIFVLDIDKNKGGEYAIDDLQNYYSVLMGNRFECISETLIAHTGGGGRHCVFQYPDRFGIRGSVSKIGHGLDIQSNGNYIIAPPSRHVSGRRYEWSGLNTAIGHAPDWLLVEVIRAESESLNKLSLNTTTINEEPTYGKVVLEGERNKRLFAHGRGLVNSFVPAEVMRRLIEFNNTRCIRPVCDEELGKIIKSVERYRS